MAKKDAKSNVKKTLKKTAKKATRKKVKGKEPLDNESLLAQDPDVLKTEVVKADFKHFCKERDIKKSFVMMQLELQGQDMLLYFPHELESKEILDLMFTTMIQVIGKVEHDEPELEVLLDPMAKLISAKVERQIEMNTAIRKALEKKGKKND